MGASSARTKILASLLLVLIPTACPSMSAAAQEPGRLTTGEHQTVVNGVRPWYRVAGRPDDSPVVFLHGGPGQGSQSFALIAGPALERDLRMISLNQRGSGWSERPWNDAYSIGLLVDDLEALRRA